VSVPEGVSEVAGFLLFPAGAWTLSSLLVAVLMPPRRRIALVGAAVSFGILVVCYALWALGFE
jgi:CHASE2 domain-containing sensor protein